MKGGLYIKVPYTIDGAFKYFVENSDISYMTKGTYGIILKCKLIDGIKSPYKNVRTIYKDTEVKNIIIKLSLLHDLKDEFTLSSGDANFQDNITSKLSKLNDLSKIISEKKKNIANFTLKDKEEYNNLKKKYFKLEEELETIKEKEIELTSVPIESFENEVIIQTKIFNETIKKLDPICPSIIYSNYFIRKLDVSAQNKNIDLLNIIYKKLLKNDENKKICILIHKLYLHLPKIKSSSFGLIGMEMMDDYVTLNNLSKHKDITTYKNIARLRLIELAVKTGYSQNDFHKSNILVNPNASDYYGEKKGNVLLIDFGFAKKIPEKSLEKLVKDYESNDFYTILKFFYTDPSLYNTFPDGIDRFNFTDYPDLYGWICPIYKNENENKAIEEIKQINENLSELKTSYKNYEDNIKIVEHKKLFTYRAIEELPNVLSTTQEPIIQDNTRKRKDISKAQSPKRIKKSPSSILEKSPQQTSLGGKRKNNKSIRKNNRQNRKTNKRRQSKCRQSKRNCK